MDLPREKSALRRRARALPPVAKADARRAGRAAAVAAPSNARFAAAERIALFASLPDEIPTRPLFDAVCDSGRVCLLPRRLPAGGLEFAAVGRQGWRQLQQLASGGSAALEPPARFGTVQLTASDLVFVPGLAFDRRGGRLGRGGGDYDRALARRVLDMPFVCGLAYACRLVDDVPMAPHDVRVDAFLSEAGWLDV